MSFLPHTFSDRLMRVAGDVSGCCVCEVGPGPGSLTRSILNSGASHVVAVERDRRFLPSLDVCRSLWLTAHSITLGTALS